MKPPECKMVFGAALYAALMPAILAKHAEELLEGADQTALHGALHEAMRFAADEASLVVKTYVRPTNTVYRWHRCRR